MLGRLKDASTGYTELTAAGKSDAYSYDMKMEMTVKRELSWHKEISEENDMFFLEYLGKVWWEGADYIFRYKQKWM